MKNAQPFPQDFSSSVRLIALALFALSVAVCAQAQTVTAIAAENSLGMVQATDGNFYGAGSAPDNLNGGIFRMTPTGEISTVYRSCFQPNCTQPGPPILGGDGNLYGVSKFGGNSSGSGTFYKLTLDGNLTTLYTFCPNAGCADGQYPQGVILASDGNFYGTTEDGGAANGHSGTVFRITPAGAFELLYTFCSLANCVDGTGPPSPPVQGSDGNFYGVAGLGGATGHGVAYRLTSTGAYTVLHNFCSATDCLDGNQPQAVTWTPSGTLLGVTNLGGDRGSGTVFEINLTKNHFRILHNFDAWVDGGNPFYPLTLANDGNFYGVVGDPFAAGFIYEETPGGVYTSLYNFACCGLGTNPFGPLLQATNGELYGETEYSHDINSGAIFQFSNGIGPSVQPVPVAGKVGQTILILGNGLTRSTRVTFNGVAAAFTVESDTYIKARVPLGATTGTVSVVTPGGRLNSNPRFVVTK
jgi:uncharacterized repeat protein (TIGR03803 family)